MDFIGGLPKAQGHDFVLVVIDRLTRCSHFIALTHPYTAKEVALVFIKEVVWLHGFPSTIVSDRDKLFMSVFWIELFRMAGTKLRHSLAYHPEMDGQSKAVNKCLETYLKCFARTKPKQWPKWLLWG